MTTSFFSAIKNAAIIYTKELDKIRNDIRTEIIIPFCDRFDMSFETDCGGWFLFDNDDKFEIYGGNCCRCGWDAIEDNIPDALKEMDAQRDTVINQIQSFFQSDIVQNIINILEAETLHGYTIGSCIDDYNPTNKRNYNINE